MRTHVIPIIALVLAATMACDEHEIPDGTSSSAPSQRSANPAAAPALTSSSPPDMAEGQNVELPADVWDGVCLAHSWQDGGENGYGTDASAQTLDHLQTLGVDWISLTPFAWMSSQSSAEIRGEHNSSIPEAAESETRIEGVVEQARSRGMQIVLKPHIWIRGGAYRGDIEPRDAKGEPAWGPWWDSYEAYILYYARQAKRLDIPVFFVGVELESAIEARPDRFLSTIEAVRSAYDGALVYAANWDERQPDRIWRALDHIGVQFYPPLSDADEPSTEQLAESIRARLAPWAEQSTRTERSLVISEVGYRAAPNAAEAPHHWPERSAEHARKTDQDLQRRAYVALFSELARIEQLQGVFLWKYFTHATTDERHPYGFSPRDYSAEAVLQRAYGAARSK